MGSCSLQLGTWGIGEANTGSDGQHNLWKPEQSCNAFQPFRKIPGIARGKTSEPPFLETEGQKLGAAGGIAIHQGTETDLVGDASAGEAFNKDADHDSQHGGAAVEALHPLELLHVDFAGVFVGEEGIVCGGLGHGMSRGGNQRWVGAKSLGRLRMKPTIAVRTTTRPMTLAMAVV